METLYYVQDSRTYTGNCMMFWKIGGGYTSNIKEAEIFSKDKATRLHRDRETDRVWPKDYIDTHYQKTVDRQRVNQYVAIQLEEQKQNGI